MRPLIEDVLDVLQEIRIAYSANSSGRPLSALRQEAVRAVAARELAGHRFKNRDSAEKSIHDACARRLNLQVSDFDALVSRWLSGDPSDLRSLLLTVDGSVRNRSKLESLLAAPPAATPTPQNYKDVLSKAAAFQAGGEGQEHRHLKEFVARNPQVLQLPAGLTGTTEYPLPSGDCVDVLFQNGGAWIAVEVKSRRSPEADVVRDIFQCVKYQAVIEAYQTSLELRPDARALLILEAQLPQRLIRLKDMLGVEVLDRVTPV